MPKEFKPLNTGKGEKSQDEIFRKMDGSKRIKLAFGLSNSIRRLAEDAIKDQHPEFSNADIKKELARRIAYGRTS